jgi:1-acyl-sn-glycerol-3-phosphate acyltransferase
MVNSARRDPPAPPAAPLPPPPLDGLGGYQRLTFRLLGELYQKLPGLGEFWLRRMSASWMTLGSFRMMHPVGIERLRGLKWSDPILLVSNHRSFFDMYMLLLLLERHTELTQKKLCPVRADFFYEQAPGLLVNLLVGGGRMFPPFFRQPERQALNKWSLDFVARELRRGSVIVGFHPEGTRNKNADPYQPLPAQPGIGKLVMDAWPVVVPAFIHGLTNDIVGDVVGNFTGARKVVVVFGEPMDLAPWQKMSNRLASHKRIADAMLARIYELGEEERAYRAERWGAI